MKSFPDFNNSKHATKDKTLKTAKHKNTVIPIVFME